MSQPRLNDHGIAWDTSIKQLAAAYGLTEDEIAVRVYSVAEQVHRHYCMSRGIVNHSEARPDQHVAISILGSLAGADWWLVHGADRLTYRIGPRGERMEGADTFAYYSDTGQHFTWSLETEGWVETPASEDVPFVNFGDDTVNEGWAINDTTEG